MDKRSEVSDFVIEDLMELRMQRKDFGFIYWAFCPIWDISTTEWTHACTSNGIVMDYYTYGAVGLMTCSESEIL